MARAGADLIVCHLGLTAGGTIGARTTLPLERAPELVDRWAEAALAVRPDLLVLVHGGPVATPEDARFVLERCRHCHGFYGASSIERLPVERAIAEEVRKFKSILRPAGRAESGRQAG
jgi:predicted TIM-barrel enzyme